MSSDPLDNVLRAASDEPWRAAPLPDETPIVAAARRGDLAALDALLDSGVSPEPDAEAKHAAIPLFRAIESGELACVERLIEAGARLDRTFPDSLRVDALDVALNQEGYYWYQWDERLIPPRGADPRYLAIAQRLLDAGVPLERDDEDGRTRLWRSAFCANDQGVGFLLRHGASLAPISREERPGETPLHAICWHGSANVENVDAWQRIVRQLVAAGAPLESVDGGPSPLCRAFFGDVCSHETVATLLELGADPNASDEDGDTPLHYAAAETDLFCVRELLKYGARPESRNDCGETPFDVATKELPRLIKWAEEERHEPTAGGPDMREYYVTLVTQTREILTLL